MATFYNKATLNYNNGSIDSNIVSGEITEVLDVTKTAYDSEYGPGCPNIYFVNIVNSGNIGFSGLTVTDNLGEYTISTEEPKPIPKASVTPLTYVDGSVRYFINGVQQPAPTVSSTTPLTITGINVPANSNVLIIYKAYPNECAPLGSDASITNIATVSGGTLSSAVSDWETVTAANAPDLSITKTLSPETVTEDSQITYTFIIQNRGGEAATKADSVYVTDTFNPILSNISVTLDGTPLAPTTGYTYNAATGVFSTVPGAIIVPPADFDSNEDGVWSTTPGVTILKVTGTI